MSLETQKLAAAAGADIGRLLKRLAVLEARQAGAGGAAQTVQVHTVSNHSRRYAGAEIALAPALHGQSCLILSSAIEFGRPSALRAQTAKASSGVLELGVDSSEQTVFYIIGPVEQVQTASEIDGQYRPPEIETY